MMDFLKNWLRKLKEQKKQKKQSHIQVESQPPLQALSQDNDHQEVMCFYCEQRNHIYIPNLDVRQYMKQPVKSDTIVTKVYEYEVKIWDPGFGDILESCKVYYSPDCKKCVNRMIVRKGTECTDM